MSQKVLLIPELRLKNESIIEANVDSKILSKTILTVQEIDLKPILGSTIYNGIITMVSDNITSGTTIAPLYAELLSDYIQPYLLNRSVAQFIVINNYKVSNKGVLKMNDNSATNVSSQELESVKNVYDNYSATYKENLIKFLQENNLVEKGKTDTNFTTEATGWFLSDNCYPSYTNDTSVSSTIERESDPVWEIEKNDYYTIEQVDALLSGITTLTPNLQQVTDVGNSTTDSIVTTSEFDVKTTDGTQVLIGAFNDGNEAGEIDVVNVSTGYRTQIEADNIMFANGDGAAVRLSIGDGGVDSTKYIFPTTNPTDGQILSSAAPDGQSKSQLSWINPTTSQDLQSVTDAGNQTTNDIILKNGAELQMDSPAGGQIQWIDNDTNKSVQLQASETGTINNSHNFFLPDGENTIDGTTRLAISVNGIYADATGNITISGTSQGLQDVITSNPDLTTSNVINGNGNDLNFDNIGNYRVGAGSSEIYINKDADISVTSTNGFDIDIQSGADLDLNAKTSVNITANSSGNNGGVVALQNATQGNHMYLNNDGSIDLSVSAVMKVNLTSNVSDHSGLRFVNLSSTSPTSSGAPLGVDSSGNVVTINASVDNNTYTTGGTYSNGTLSLNNNSGQTISITGFYTGATDTFTTGGTYSNGTLTLKNNTGGTITISGFTTGQTITLSGDVSGSGITAITTTIGANKVTNAMLAGSIANSKLSNSTISGIALGGSLSGLSATDSTLTFSGTYDGSTARTVGINLATANTWIGAITYQKANPTRGTVYNGIILNSTGTSATGGTGNQVYAPSIHSTVYSWNTTASVPVDLNWVAQGAQQSSSGSYWYILNESVNSGTTIDRFGINSAGQVALRQSGADNAGFYVSTENTKFNQVFPSGQFIGALAMNTSYLGLFYNGTTSNVMASNTIPLVIGTQNTEAFRIDTNQNILAGTTTTVASSKLTIASTTQGVLFPRMTTTQKNAISSPAEGLMVYDLTLHKLCVYSGSAWETITSA